MNINLAGPYQFGKVATWDSPSLTVMGCEIRKARAKLDLPDEGNDNTYQYPLSPVTDGHYNQGACIYPFGTSSVCTSTVAAAGSGATYQNSGTTQGNVKMPFGYLGGKTPNSASTGYSGPLGEHLDGANFLLADGHVKWFQPDQVSPGIVPTAAGKYQGQDNGGNSAASVTNMKLSDGTTPCAVTFSPR
jgi:prepilin-type processing-associated H-X9-DG protein